MNCVGGGEAINNSRGLSRMGYRGSATITTEWINVSLSKKCEMQLPMRRLLLEKKTSCSKSSRRSYEVKN